MTPITRPSAVVPLTSPLLPEVFERAVAATYRRHKSEPIELVLDLSAIAYVEVPALCCAIALVKSRRSRKMLTAFRLPKSKAVRDILRVWRFFEASAAAADCPVEDVIYDSLPLFEERITALRGYPTGVAALEFNPAWRPGDRNHRNFFEFLTFHLPRDKDTPLDSPVTAIPRMEAERWQDDLVRAVLEKHLPGRAGEENDVSRVVIFESLANAVQHPKASMIQVASRFYLSQKAHLQGFLTMCVWDDGESMVDTLREALEKGGSVRAKKFPASWYERVHVSMKTLSGKTLKPKKDVVDQGIDPTPSDPSEVVLIACLAPGVTRTIAFPTEAVSPLPNNGAGEDSESPGMGLFTLVRTVVDRYQGSLGFRCGRYYMSYRLAPDGIRKRRRAHYHATVTVLPERYPPFPGNLLTIRLPIIQPERHPS